MRLPLTRTQKKYLVLLEKGYCLEVEKRAPGFISQSHGAEIAGRTIRFDAAQRMIGESLVEKLSEDSCTVKYGISPAAVQLLDSCREAHRRERQGERSGFRRWCTHPSATPKCWAEDLRGRGKPADRAGLQRASRKEQLRGHTNIFAEEPPAGSP